MHIIFIIIGAVIIAFVIKALLTKKEGHAVKTPKLKEYIKGPNDKIIVIKNIHATDLKKTIAEYKKMNDVENDEFSLQLTTLDKDTCVITFPENIYFESFCVFINYLNYPIDIKVKPAVLAWTTIQEDSWLHETALNKKAMIFVPEDDTEFDLVMITTEDNIGYKFGFAVGNNRRQLDAPKKHFVAPNITQESLADKPTEAL